MPHSGATLPVQSRISVSRSMTSTMPVAAPARSAGQSRASAIRIRLSASTAGANPHIRPFGLAALVRPVPQLVDRPLDLGELVEALRAGFVPGHIDGALVDH